MAEINYFRQIPNWVLDKVLPLSSDYSKLLLHLYRHANFATGEFDNGIVLEKNQVWATRRYLADQLGWSEAKVRQKLRRLKGLGVLEIDAVRGSNRTVITLPSADSPTFEHKIVQLEHEKRTGVSLDTMRDYDIQWSSFNPKNGPTSQGEMVHKKYNKNIETYEDKERQEEYKVVPRHEMTRNDRLASLFYSQTGQKLSKEQVNALLVQYGFEKVVDYIHKITESSYIDSIDNPAGFLFRALKEGWKFPTVNERNRLIRQCQAENPDCELAGVGLEKDRESAKDIIKSNLCVYCSTFYGRDDF